MKISFIATVFNEEKTIDSLLSSIITQSKLPDEIILVDGGSTDRTVDSIKGEKRFKIFVKKGNRAVGRNEAIRSATGDIIVCSDAGCVLDKDWVKNITKPFQFPTHQVGKNGIPDVVAGYYAAKSTSLFQRCLAPYVLVMPDKVNSQDFLPASRSMAFKKSVWEKTGGFPENYSHNEDYVWAKTLRQQGFNIVFAKDAIVYWIPRKNLKDACIMFFRFAFGDAQAKIFRPKVVFIFARYLAALILLSLTLASNSLLLLISCYLLLIAYLAWSILKNYSYVKNARAIFILPILQISSDLAVMIGTIFGFAGSFWGGGYSKLAIFGLSWMGGLRFATRIMAFVRTAILARLLDPSQFGAYGVALLVLAMLEIFTETGVNVLLIQEKEHKDIFIHSAWIVSIIRGFVIFLLLFLSAPFVARFFNSPQSVFLLRLISIAPLLRGFINPSVIFFQKNLEFNKEFRYRFVLFFVDATVAIIATLITHSAIGLAIGFLTDVLLELILSFIIVKPTPKLVWNKEYFTKIFKRGSWVTAGGIFNYLFQNADNIVVGRLLGTLSLGLYEMAYTLSTVPITEVGDVFTRVTFPVYTKMSDDKPRLKRAFIKSTFVLSVLTVPFGVILFLFPKEIVHIALGDKWLGMVPVLPILAVFGVVRAISGFASTMFLAVGKQEYITWVTLVSFLGLVLPIFPLVMRFGIVGAGTSAMIGTVLALPLFAYYTIKVFKKEVAFMSGKQK